MEKEKVVIIGFGWVGQANALALVLDGYEVGYYDIGHPPHHYEKYAELYQKIRRFNSPLALDDDRVAYIVCVSDHIDEVGNQDITNIESALASLEKAKGTVVLRSTILPSKLKGLDFDIYLPEFLHEKVAVKECANPQYVVVAKKRPDAREPSFMEIWRRRSIKMIDTTPEDAAHIKYLSNIWNAVRVAFTNEYGCSIAEPADDQTIRRIDNVLNFILENNPYLRYGRAYGGHCLPKDTIAYAKWAKEHNRHISLLDGAIASNDTHREREKKYPRLPEWFSNWPEPAGSGWVALHILGKSIRRNLLHPIAAWKRRKTVVHRKSVE